MLGSGVSCKSSLEVKPWYDCLKGASEGYFSCKYKHEISDIANVCQWHREGQFAGTLTVSHLIPWWVLAHNMGAQTQAGPIQHNRDIMKMG